MTSTDIQEKQPLTEENPENKEAESATEQQDEQGETGEEGDAASGSAEATGGQRPEEMIQAVGKLFSQLEAVERFMARRFDEISMEINATSQQVDMAEDGMTRRFSEILEILGAINYIGQGDSAANTGVELEAVIEDTEDAANKILDSADRIASYVDDDVDWNDESVRANVREQIKNDVQEILLACTFQDLTGQRIRNTLNSLHDIENRLSETFDRLGIEVNQNVDVEKHIAKAHSQSEIDALLQGYSAAQGSAPAAPSSGGGQKKSGDSGGKTSQEDIDSMFD